MAESLRPAKGGFLRPFGCGWFIRQYLAGKGPEGSTKIDPIVVLPRSIFALSIKKLSPRSPLENVLKKLSVIKSLKKSMSAKKKLKIFINASLKKVSRKFTHMRYHSFLIYFGVESKTRRAEFHVLARG